MVDILLATYNGEKYLAEQLDSLFAQTYDDFMIIIRDDGSTDGTLAIAGSYAQRYPGKIKIVDGTPSTGSAKGNFFRLLEHSRAEYTMFCDQDDVWYEDKIQRSLNMMDGEEGAPTLVHSDLAVVDEGLNLINGSLFLMQKLKSEYRSVNKLLAQNNITGCTVMINKRLRELIRPSEGALMHDWWIGLAAAAFGKIEFIDQATVRYRQHDANDVGAKEVSSGRYIKDQLSDTGGIHEKIADTYNQAQAFLETYRDMLDDGQKKIVEAYASMKDCGIIKRLGLLSRNRFFKSGFLRKMGQIVYG